MFAAILALLLKIYFLQKSCREISDGLSDILDKNFDTNALLTISSRDREMCRFAALLNGQLAQLRQEHLRYRNGDREIKEAITNISHDLRTPLTAINGYLELLSRELSAPGQPGSPKVSPSRQPSDPPEVSTSRRQPGSPEISPPQKTAASPSPGVLRYLAILRNRTAAMKQMTEELFRYSVVLSREESAPAPLSLNRVLEESLISGYTELNRHNITPVISLPQTPVIRNLDESLLTRIFDNILSNAVKYSGGDLEVTLTEEGRITFSNLAPGMTPVLAARLFDRYFTVETISRQNPTAEEKAPGFSPESIREPSDPADGSPVFLPNSSGLGLSIARLLTERMGGVIDSSCKNGRLYITVQFSR